MEKQTKNNSVVITAVTFAVVGILAWGAFVKNKPQSELENIAHAIETASDNKDKGAASLLFDQLTELKYKYGDANNIPCLKAVMTLTGGADEVNTTGNWTGKQETLTAINQCKG